MKPNSYNNKRLNERKDDNNIRLNNINNDKFVRNARGDWNVFNFKATILIILMLSILVNAIQLSTSAIVAKSEIATKMSNQDSSNGINLTSFPHNGESGKHQVCISFISIIYSLCSCNI